ncbi:uncharacterized protein EV420DRAFT_1271394 [Desarmillaria tabescens]|uniref:Heterokaryon incompatibility domain-containing protein n=1 Tax=Armillaria tabescens TaxID=1929756 RepID=A0AA39KEY9_ARMTA|nr:uncharacterized protein EV420DRAFT_1271394 [Desarmillaria tabescens]KAK0457558.1 hypothetical protein EV420DRAFT_1271394 [Desarmillaria tabescens]
MLINKQITDGDAPPRRVWDLVANRVVPWWASRKYPWGISHAWVDENDLKREMTPINGYEWPVPMPKDADLNLIRIEMLRLGAEYIWLDVLCLRQKGQGENPRGKRSQEEWDRREALRREEWKVDLPTIGWIYHKAEKVVCYFSGLGLPLSFKEGDFESDRCWFNRAWTLQEIREDMLIAGKTDDDDTLMKKSKQKFMTVDMRKLIDEKLSYLKEICREDSMLGVLSQMQTRKSTKSVDKVAGLVFLFYSQYIPIYDADQSEEDAWTELVNITQDWFRGEFFFFYPGPGNGKKLWHPSWKQVMTDNLSGLTMLPWDRQSVIVYRTEEGADRYNGPRIDSCRVWGLSDEPTAAMSRHGKLDVTDGSGKKHTVKIVANHAFPIPDDLYTLIGIRSSPYFSAGVIGKIEGAEKKFRKVSVINMGDREAARINVMGSRAETYLL